MKKLIVLILLLALDSYADLTVSEIIKLKTNGVSDSVIIALIQRQPIQPKQVKVDIESYDYFYNNYLYPRTLRYKYEMLYPYRFDNRRFLFRR